ncbi:MAG: 3-deoxy-D-manno-octulosonic acid transferase [Bdellovibrionota bacterium]
MFVRLLSSAVGTVLIPFLFLRAVFDGRWRRSLEERRGLGGWLDSSWQTQDVIWFHGASVGEINGLAPLLSEVRKRFPAVHILVTTTSLTGRDEAQKRRLGDSVLLFPLDHPKYARRVLNRVKPKVVVLAETELWPNFLFSARELNIPVLLVNGRISSYSYPQYTRARAFFRPVLRSLRQILVQTSTDAERFIVIGAEPERVTVCGSTKYSHSSATPSASERTEFADLVGIDPNRPCFVAGSVRSGEDETVIRAYQQALKTVPGLQMIIAPRHPERFEKVARMLRDRGIAYHRRSDGKPAGRNTVVLLDTIGELARAYSIASFAFVGGSLVDIGGHNPFEPAAFREPVLMGPHTSNVADAVEELSSAGGLIRVENETELVSSIVRLAEHPDECLLRGAQAFAVWKRSSGAVERVLPVLETYLTPAASFAPVQAAM